MNSCRFPEPTHNAGEITILHFVLETQPQDPEHNITISNYRIHLVVRGKGILRTQYAEYVLSEGDIFFTFPATQYTLETVDEFKYLYIGFIGTRTNAILDKMKIYVRNCVFKNFANLIKTWENAQKI